MIELIQEGFWQVLLSVVATGVLVSLGWAWRIFRSRATRRGRLVYVSVGGTCRDPMAMAVTESILRQRGEKIHVAARGTLLGHADGPSPAARSIVLERLGKDALRHHRPRVIDANTVHQAQLVLAMDKAVEAELRKAYPESADKIHEFCAFFGDETIPEAPPNPWRPDDSTSAAAQQRYRDYYDYLDAVLRKEDNIQKLLNVVRR